MKTFYRWTDAVRYLRELLDRMAPLAGPGIAIEQTASGRRLSCTVRGGGGGGPAYAGPFLVKGKAVENGPGGKVTVVDGSDPAGAYAGWVYVNAERFQLEATELEVDRDGYLYVESIWDEEEEKPGKPELVFSSVHPHSEEDAFRLVLARIEFSSGAPRVRQFHFGNVCGIIWGTCAYQPGE